MGTLDISIIAGALPALGILAGVGLIMVIKWVADIWP
jgi:hypothetical protein